MDRRSSKNARRFERFVGFKKILISGMPRAGTTMLMLMMTSFKNCYVFTDMERHPLIVVPQYNRNNFVIKHPFGYFEEFPPPYNYRELCDRYNYKIISMLRDPRDVLVSKHKKDLSKYWVEPLFVYRNCEEYLMNIDNPKVLFVRYEDLVTTTESQMNKISEFLGFECTDTYKSFFELKAAQNGVNISLNSPRPIDKDSIGNWKKEEHAERIKEVMDDTLISYIKILGYRFN